MQCSVHANAQIKSSSTLKPAFRFCFHGEKNYLSPSQCLSVTVCCAQHGRLHGNFHVTI